MSHNPEFDTPEENVHTFSMIMHADGYVSQGEAAEAPPQAASATDDEKEN
jgi:hypothetical protein